MEYEWDKARSEANIAAGRPGFEAVKDFHWETAIVHPSEREGEARWTAIGLIGGSLYHIVFVDRGDRTRIISLRRASRKERSRYVGERTRDTDSDG